MHCDPIEARQVLQFRHILKDKGGKILRFPLCQQKSSRDQNQEYISTSLHFTNELPCLCHAMSICSC